MPGKLYRLCPDYMLVTKRRQRNATFKSAHEGLWIWNVCSLQSVTNNFDRNFEEKACFLKRICNAFLFFSLLSYV